MWGLFSDGWALAASNEGYSLFPLWPAHDYAAHCATGIWAGFAPREIDLDTLFEKLLPNFTATKTLAAIFPNLNGQGVTPALARLEADLREELAKIE